MAFFNSAPSQTQSIQAGFGGPPAQSQTNNMFGGLDFGNPSASASGSSTPMAGFGAGISLPLTPSNFQSTAANGPPKPAAPQQQALPAAKKDPFADLANW